MPKIPDHDTFVIPGITDTAKQMAEATALATGDNYKGPESTIMHYHRFNEDCTPESQKHVTYTAEQPNGVTIDNAQV